MKDFDEHKKEPEEAPFLKSIPKKNIFQTPEGYFEDQEKFWEEIAQEDSPHTPVLDEVEKKNVFSVPEGYFQQNEQKILSAISPEENHHSGSDKIKPLFYRPRVMTGMAAAVALLISLGIWMNQFGSAEPDSEKYLAQVSTEALINHIDIAALDMDMILDVVGDESLNFEYEEEVFDAETEDEDISAILNEMDAADLESILNELE